MNLIAKSRQFVGRLKLHRAYQLLVAVVGGSVVLAGIAMLVLPGPAILVIPLGLAILATEFLWARRWLKRARALLPNGNKRPAGFSWPPALFIPHRHYLLILAALFGIWWLALAIQPLHRNVWLLENALAIAGVVFLTVFHRRLLFSLVSYTLIFVFMCPHQIGAHYSYSEDYLINLKKCATSEFVTPSLQGVSDSALRAHFRELVETSRLPSSFVRSGRNRNYFDIQFASLRLSFAREIGHSGLFRLSRFLRSMSAEELEAMIAKLPHLNLKPIPLLAAVECSH